jgi:hypothetical protein
MKLLLIRDDGDNAIDEALMLVPDDFDEEKALEESMLDRATLVGQWDVMSEKAGSDMAASEFRSYIG